MTIFRVLAQRIPAIDASGSHEIQTDPHDNTQAGPILTARPGSVLHAVSQRVSRSSGSIGKDLRVKIPSAGGSSTKFPADIGAKVVGATVCSALEQDHTNT